MLTVAGHSLAPTRWASRSFCAPKKVTERYQSEDLTPNSIAKYLPRHAEGSTKNNRRASCLVSRCLCVNVFATENFFDTFPHFPKTQTTLCASASLTMIERSVPMFQRLPLIIRRWLCVRLVIMVLCGGKNQGSFDDTRSLRSFLPFPRGSVFLTMASPMFPFIESTFIDHGCFPRTAARRHVLKVLYPEIHVWMSVCIRECFHQKTSRFVRGVSLLG